MTNDFHPEQNGVTAVFLQAPNTFSTTHKYLIHLFSTFAGTFIYNCVGLEALDFDFTTAAEFYTEIKFYYGIYVSSTNGHVQLSSYYLGLRSYDAHMNQSITLHVTLTGRQFFVRDIHASNSIYITVSLSCFRKVLCYKKICFLPHRNTYSINT